MGVGRPTAAILCAERVGRRLETVAGAFRSSGGPRAAGPARDRSSPALRNGLPHIGITGGRMLISKS